jgi:hypothetical protein
MCHPSLIQVTDLANERYEMRSYNVGIYAVRLFKFGTFFEVQTFDSYKKAMDYAITNLEGSDWDIKELQR